MIQMFKQFYRDPGIYHCKITSTPLPQGTGAPLIWTAHNKLCYKYHIVHCSIHLLMSNFPLLPGWGGSISRGPILVLDRTSCKARQKGGSITNILSCLICRPSSVSRRPLLLACRLSYVTQRPSLYVRRPLPFDWRPSPVTHNQFVFFDPIQFASDASDWSGGPPGMDWYAPTQNRDFALLLFLNCALSPVTFVSIITRKWST